MFGCTVEPGVDRLPPRGLVDETLTEGHPACNLIVLDCKDAFKQLKVDPSESRYLAGSATLDRQPGLFVYKTVLFGVKTGPLLWGRLAALVMRMTASLFSPEEAANQCYVDDPLGVHGGTAAERIKSMALTLLLWQVLGLQMAWDKAAQGLAVDWLGARVEVTLDEFHNPAGVLITISKDKADKVLEVATPWLNSSHVPRREFRQFTGLCAWIAPVVPTLRPFVQILWAALAAKPAKGESRLRLSTARVQLALRWIVAFATEGLATWPRWFPAAQTSSKIIIGFDASTTGGGAWLRLPHSQQIVKYCMTTWTTADETVLGAVRYVPDYQAVWETYMLLIAVATWIEDIQKTFSTFEVVGDALGILKAVITRKARCPTINLLIMELQLLLGRSMYDMYATHIWSEKNDIADKLSRYGEGASIPRQCRDAAETPARRPRLQFLSGARGR